MQFPVTETSTNLETVTIETRASKTMLKYYISHRNRGEIWVKSGWNVGESLLTRRPCWFLGLRSRFLVPFYIIFVFFEFKLISLPKPSVYMSEYFTLETITWWLNCQGWQIRRSQVPITITEAKIDERFDDFAELDLILLLPSNNTSCIHLLVNIFNESIYGSPVRNFLNVILAGRIVSAVEAGHTKFSVLQSLILQNLSKIWSPVIIRPVNWNILWNKFPAYLLGFCFNVPMN